MRFSRLEAVIVVVVSVYTASCIFSAFIPPAKLVLHTGVGWLYFLGRTVPQISVEPLAVVEAAAVIVLVCGGVHSFGRWMGQARGWRWSAGRSLALTAGVVVMFLTSIATAGLVHHVGWLIRSPYPLFEATWGGPRGDVRYLAGRLCGLGDPGQEPEALRQAIFSRAAELNLDLVEFVVFKDEALSVLVYHRDPALVDEAGGVVCTPMEHAAWSTETLDAVALQALQERLRAQGSPSSR